MWDYKLPIATFKELEEMKNVSRGGGHHFLLCDINIKFFLGKTMVFEGKYNSEIGHILIYKESWLLLTRYNQYINFEGWKEKLKIIEKRLKELEKPIITDYKQELFVSL